MGSSQSSTRVQAATAANHHPLLASGEFKRLGENFVPVHGMVFNCEITRAYPKLGPDVPCTPILRKSIESEMVYGCDLTPAMEIEITRLKVAYPQLKIVSGRRLFVPELPEYMTCARVSLYLIQNPYDQETTVVGWRLAVPREKPFDLSSLAAGAVATATAGQQGVLAEPLQ